MQRSSIPAKFPRPFANNAGMGYIRTIPDASQVGVTAGAASLTDGFPPACFTPVGSGGTPPWGQDFNGILNQISTWSQWQQAGASIQFDLTFCTEIGGYPDGAVLASTTQGIFWLNTADNNTTNPDSGGASGWIAMGPTTLRGIFYGADTGTANALTVATTTPASSTLTAGMVFLIKKGASANTTAATAAISGNSAAPVIWADGTALVAGDWPANVPALISYDGTNFRVLSVMGPSVFARVVPAAYGQTILTADANYYVSNSGSDSNVGSIGSPFLTIQHAINVVQTLNTNGHSVTINCANGTYASSTVSQPFFGGGVVTLLGNASTPSLCVISCGSSASGILSQYGASIDISGFSISGAALNFGALTAQFNGAINIAGHMEFGVNTGYHIGALDKGLIRIKSGYSITGGGSAHYEASDAAQINTDVAAPISVVISGTPSFSTSFAISQNISLIRHSSSTFGGSVTGARYYSINNSMIDTVGGGANYFPGSSPGATATGGQYA